MIGRVFEDRYEIARKLGSGGMADVYLANDRLLGRQVALKILSTRYAHDEQFVERFRREASSAAGLNHPNIVQIYDRGEAEGTYYIAMEYLEGRSLKEIILTCAPLSSDLLISISVQILEALRSAHRRDIIHRDIKPQNIIIDNDGRAKVTDFGIARAGSASTMTEAGSILGTAQYLSPEQAQGQPVEAASDLYSLGVVMYEMATGRPPFDGDNPVSIATQHVHEHPIPPRNIAPDAPEDLEAVILRSLGKKPTERYLTAQAMLDDLRKVQDGQAISAPAVFREEATRVMSPAAAAFVAQPTQVRPKVSDALDRAPEPQHDEPPRRRSVWPWILVVVLILALAGGAYAISSNFGSAGTDLVVVPGVMGLSEAEARQKVEAAGFVFKNAGDQPSADVKAGDVARQDPEESTKLAKGKSVSVWLSSGKGTVKTPDVVGMNQDAAVDLIEGMKLVATVQPVASTLTGGTVVDQNPKKGTDAQPGSTVIISISNAPTMVIVPAVVGLSPEQATAMLATYSLRARIVLRETRDYPPNLVIGESPTAGVEVEKNSYVDLIVSTVTSPRPHGHPKKEE
ncbi:MAG TPA: Stk1 family PASTA domain-containing Ser/Thr kinase [Thermoleophilia bacterium]|nr:Stk1 family PASTA domain-containing Ser/Thr kinase [Thermoleophilia bacterium]